MRIERLRRTVLVAFLLCSVQVLNAQGQSAQADSTSQRLWVDLGSGQGTYKQGSAGVLSANYRRNEHFFTLRSAINSSTFSGALLDAALLYGRAFGLPPVWISNQHIWHVSAGAGFGFVWGDFAGGDTIGLPMQAQFSFHPIGGIGLSVTAFYNLNLEQSFGGVTIGVQIGAMP